MASQTLPSRYAKSLLQLAQEQNKLDVVYRDFLSIKNTLADSSEFRAFLKSPIIDADKKLAVIERVFFSSIDELTAAFLKLVVKKGRENRLGDIVNSFIEQYNQLLQITKIKIVSATEMSNEQETALINKIKAAEKFTNIIVEKKVDPALIGGYIVSYNGKQIDASVSKSLSNLATLIEDNSYVKKYS